MCKLLKGAPVASELNSRTRQDVEALAGKGITPGLAIVRVGDRPDDLAYANSAVKRCSAVGVEVRQTALPVEAGQNALCEAIDRLNNDAGVHGILLLRPLPEGYDEAAVCRRISAKKDVDGVTLDSLAGVFTGSGHGFPPCTAQACIEILEHYGVELAGKRAVVVGRSLVVGKPAAMLLLARHATVTICHTRTAELKSECKSADVLIVAAGRPGVLDESFLSPHQIVVDVGIHVLPDGSMCGDVSFDKENPPVSGITPVPGGVGAVTTALLARHTVTAAMLA